ncbi:hypothetical protein Tsubulata_011456 [Turnera subulata]|uniref:Uncharacterized protein n=1 Tax=Turnera subulata TaxID=218843 RepID=A0A9Q0FYS8_9ROSI|nr:hypothetical protein Tsubulata_011456 [Turnera subulata]
MAALSDFCLSPCPERVEAFGFSKNLSTRLSRPSFIHVKRKSPSDHMGQLRAFKCFALNKPASPLESEDIAKKCTAASMEEGGHVMKFKITDFKMLDRVSSGLGGRADEVVFEGIVKDPSSPLYNTKVVLRELKTTQAQRRGRRAIEVLKKLVHRRLMYHSYSMQVHGYVSSHPGSGHDSFTLVHGWHGSFSLRHWLQQADWLPTLEATLALDEESARRVGEDTVGGPAVSRQLRIIRLLMRDLLIGVCS